MSELRSPLTLSPSAVDLAPLTLTDLSALAKVQVKAPPGGQIRAALGTPFGRATRPTSPGSRLPAATSVTWCSMHGTLVIGSGPGEWLVLGPPGAAAVLRAGLTALVARVDEFASVVDLTHGRALVRLRGAASAALLAKVCAVDLADPVTPDGGAFRSSLARVVTDVVRDDLSDGTRSYLLHCERSSGQYLAETLLDAGSEFDIGVAPFDPRGQRP